MTQHEFIDIPRHTYGRLCVVNWNDVEHEERTISITVDDTIRYKERAKKQKELIEMEDHLLEALSTSEVSESQSDRIGCNQLDSIVICSWTHSTTKELSSC